MPKDILITGLKNYQVEKLSGYGHTEVYVRYVGEVICPHCSGLKHRKKDSFWRRLHHTSIGPRRTYLIVRSHKFHCLSCKKYFNLRLPGVKPRFRSTELFRREVYLDHHEGKTQKVLSSRLKISTATVERWYRDFIGLENLKRQSSSAPRVLGIDEHFFTRKKGYMTTFADLSKNKVYDITLGRSESSLRGYLRGMKNKENTKVILMDLSETYRSIAKKHFPGAKIVADRFHVVRLINHRFLETWKIFDEIGRKNRGLLSLMRRHEKNLKPEQRVKLQSYFDKNPGLEAVYSFKQSLMEIILTKERNKDSARKVVKQFLWHIEELKNSGFSPLQKLGVTLESWKEEVARMFRFTKTNSITEGLHNKMEMISRRAFGFRNFNNFRLRVRVHCG